MIAYKAVRVEDGRMWSLFAGWTHNAGEKVEYHLGHTLRFPRDKPGMAVRTRERVSASTSGVIRSGAKVLVLRCEVELVAPGESVPFLAIDPELLWCSSITPLAVVRPDGTEEGEVHRVVLEISKNLAVMSAERARGWVNLKRPKEMYGEDLVKGRVESWFGTAEPGTTIEVTTRVLSRPEPEPERVRIVSHHKCPKCNAGLASDKARQCPICDVLFEEVPDA